MMMLTRNIAHAVYGADGSNSGAEFEKIDCGAKSFLRPPGTNTSSQNHSQAHNSHPPIWSTMAVPPWSTATRPLSDIRELTEPSLGELMPKDHHLSEEHIERKPSLTRKLSVKARRSAGAPEETRIMEENRGRRSISLPRTPGSQEDQSSIYSIPGGNVPPRSSSQPRRKRSVSRDKGPSALPPPPPRGIGYSIPNRGKSRSPVRDVAYKLDPVTSDSVRRLPSRTFSRSPQPRDILEFPSHRHHRISSDLQLTASLFVGGSAIEGSVRVMVDEAERIRHKKTLAVARISVDLVGVEEASGGRKAIFLNLATELIDADNPPPRTMVDSDTQISPIDPFWYLIPSITILPFLLSLPLDVGPPTFHSRHAKIRYVVCVTLLVRDTGRQYLVRTSQDVSVLSVYDPEKALMSLPSPLTASDERVIPHGTSIEVIKMTAGLHRQVWVSGTSIFTDVHIANSSRKNIRKLELQLERDILFYKHAAAATMEKSASQARIFDSNERSILSKTNVKCGSYGWNGVPAHSTDTRTCDLDIPRGHATVKCVMLANVQAGKFFEVRYFLNIIVYSSHTKLVTVQLPIVLIHMNSLDVVPNSVDQVAAAIEERRYTHNSNGRPSSSLGFRQPRPVHHQSPCIYRALSQPRMRPQMQPQLIQGRAFAAPRMASLERARADAAEINMLKATLDASPRKRYRQTQIQVQRGDSRSQQWQQQQQQQQQQRQRQQSRPNLLKSHSSFDSQRGMLFPHIYNDQIAQPQHSHYRQRHQQHESHRHTRYDRQQQRRHQWRPGPEYTNEEKQQLNQEIQHGFEYQTPPSNRKARLVNRSEADNLAHQLRHVRSDELNTQPASRGVADDSDHDSRYQRQHRYRQQAPPPSAVVTGRNTDAGKYADLELEEPSPRPGFRDAEVDLTLNLKKPAPTHTSAATSTAIPSFLAMTSGQVGEDLEQQQRQTYGNGGGISGIGNSSNSSHTGRAGISSLGGSVLRRLEPNRVFESRKKRNAEREREQEREQEREPKWEREREWQRPSDRNAEKKRERSRGRTMFPTIVGAAGKNTKFGTPFSSSAAPASAPVSMLSSTPLLSNPSFSSWWEARREGYGDGRDKERARHWI